MEAKSIASVTSHRSHRGHKSSVNKAIAAHRQRSEARRERSRLKLETATNVTKQFFPSPVVSAPATTVMESTQSQPAPVSKNLGAEHFKGGMREIFAEAPERNYKTYAADNFTSSDPQSEDSESIDMPKGQYLDKEA